MWVVDDAGEEEEQMTATVVVQGFGRASEKALEHNVMELAVVVIVVVAAAVQIAEHRGTRA